MVTRAQLRKILILSGTFLTIVLGLVALRWRLGLRSSPMVEPTFVAVALVPFAFYLAVTGRLKRFSGGGFEFVLRKQAERAVLPPGADGVGVVRADFAADSPGVTATDLEEAGGTTTLALEVGTGEPSSVAGLRETIGAAARLPDLEYVVFTDDTGCFEGYADAGAVEALVEGDPETAQAVAAEVASGDILDRPLVTSASVARDRTNRETLAALDDRGLDEIAVVGDRGEFLRVVAREEIVQRILSGTLREV